MPSALTQWDWQRISDAVDTISDGGAKKIENDNWSAYKAGTVIRIDIKEQH